MKRIILAIALLTPLSAFAMGCDRTHEAASCAEGFVWDTEAGACVKQVIG
ncbi:hypothetical protein [Celeribacter sp.]